MAEIDILMIKPDYHDLWSGFIFLKESVLVIYQ